MTYSRIGKGTVRKALHSGQLAVSVSTGFSSLSLDLSAFVPSREHPADAASGLGVDKFCPPEMNFCPLLVCCLFIRVVTTDYFLCIIHGDKGVRIHLMDFLE